MSQLIDKVHLLQVLNNCDLIDLTSIKQEIVNIVESEPVVNLRPRPVGEWSVYNEDDPKHIFVSCSCCRTRYRYATCYCPNCGAHMIPEVE